MKESPWKWCECQSLPVVTHTNPHPLNLPTAPPSGNCEFKGLSLCGMLSLKAPHRARSSSGTTAVRCHTGAEPSLQASTATSRLRIMELSSGLLDPLSRAIVLQQGHCLLRGHPGAKTEHILLAAWLTAWLGSVVFLEMSLCHSVSTPFLCLDST